VHCLAFAPDGKTLASLGWARVRGSFDVVKVWDVSTRRALASFETRLGRDLPDSSRGTSPGGAFAPDARTLARSYADRTVKLWDLKTRKVRQSFPVTDRQA